jgi:hypothetical protein
MSQLLETKEYPHAPITEAAIEIRIASEVSTENQEAVVRRLKKITLMLSPCGHSK